MATDRQIKTRINRLVKAFEAKDWDRFKTEHDWLLENLDERQQEQYYPEIITRLDKIDPGDDAPSFFNRGVAKGDLGDHKGAIADYDEAIRLKPDYASAFNNRGNAKGKLGDHQGAIADFDEAIRLKPDFAEAFNNRGNAKQDLEDYQGAVADYDEAIRLKPDYAFAFHNRGNAKRNLEDYHGAIADYDEAIRLKPDFAEAIHNRAVTLAQLEAKQKAEETKEKIENTYKENFAQFQNPIEISKRFESHISESKRRLRHLRRLNTATFIFLFLLLPSLWIILRIHLKSIGPTGCSAEDCSSYSEFLLILSITLTTSFLASPLFYFLRRIHHDMRVERAMLEDFRRKWTMLNLRLLERDMVAQNTAIVMDHFDQHGTPEVLAEAYAGKSSARRDDRFIEKLAQRIADLLAKQSS